MYFHFKIHLKKHSTDKTINSLHVLLMFQNQNQIKTYIALQQNTKYIFVAWANTHKTHIDNQIKVTIMTTSID